MCHLFKICSNPPVRRSLSGVLTRSAAAPNGRPADRAGHTQTGDRNMTTKHVGRGRSRTRSRRAAVNPLAVGQVSSSVRPTSDGRPTTMRDAREGAATDHGVRTRDATHGPRSKLLGPSLLSTGRQNGCQGLLAATQVPRCENLGAPLAAPEKLWETRGPRAFSFGPEVRS